MKGFSGEVDGSIRAEELVRFAAQVENLNNALLGSATFETVEMWVKIHLTMTDKLGTVGLSGFLLDEPNNLQFGLALDQTYLKSVCSLLQMATKRFPVIGKPY